MLKLSENLIKEVDQKAFLNLGTSLEHLDLSGNKLKMMQEETFRPLYGLQVCRFIPFFSSFIIFSSSFPSLSLAFKLTLFSIPLLTFLVFRALSEGRGGGGQKSATMDHKQGE